jgi:hypothetical protein
MLASQALKLPLHNLQNQKPLVRNSMEISAVVETGMVEIKVAEEEIVEDVAVLDPVVVVVAVEALVKGKDPNSIQTSIALAAQNKVMISIAIGPLEEKEKLRTSEIRVQLQISRNHRQIDLINQAFLVPRSLQKSLD